MPLDLKEHLMKKEPASLLLEPQPDGQVKVMVVWGEYGYVADNPAHRELQQLIGLWKNRVELKAVEYRSEDDLGHPGDGNVSVGE